ncbi:MAG: hypothetical protein ABIA21_00170 [Candidatus Aenigmatarchaeota archaeon]
MDPLVKLMGLIDLIAAILIILSQTWLGWQILGWILLIKGIISLLS